MNTSLAFLDWGRWVADCPECLDAQLVYEGTVRRDRATCTNGHAFDIEMPDPDVEREIVAALAGRSEAERMWYPEDHARAREAGLPVGQSPDELRAEDAALRSAGREAAQDDLRAALAGAGIEVGPDGAFSGTL